MSRALVVEQAGPGVTVQDRGRPGHLARGLSRGGAADPRALHEGAALLGQSADLAALEMAGLGGRFRASGGLRIALTGAPMQAGIDGEPVAWHASHRLADGQTLTIGPARRGVYGYLHIGGGIATEPMLGSRAAHLTAGLGAPVAAGDRLPVGDDPGGDTGLRLPVEDRFAGGTVRVLPSVQTDRFDPAQVRRFEATCFTRDERGNRMGVQLRPDGGGFAAEGGLSVLSEVIVPGDIQITGDGAPFVLLAECQTTGGYPRIATVLPADLPVVAQAAPGTALRFRFVDLAEALAIHRRDTQALADLPRRAEPLVRDPGDIRDLLSYQLIGGVTAGDEEP